MREIQFYQTRSGICPVREFLDGLDSKQAKKVTWVLQLVRELPRPPEKFFKKLSGTEIWEVRVGLESKALRILGFMDGGRLIILTGGFSKKTRRTPKRELERAMKRRREYFSRKR